MKYCPTHPAAAVQQLRNDHLVTQVTTATSHIPTPTPLRRSPLVHVKTRPLPAPTMPPPCPHPAPTLPPSDPAMCRTHSPGSSPRRLRTPQAQPSAAPTPACSSSSSSSRHRGRQRHQQQTCVRQAATHRLQHMHVHTILGHSQSTAHACTCNNRHLQGEASPVMQITAVGHCSCCCCCCSLQSPPVWCLHHHLGCAEPVMPLCSRPHACKHPPPQNTHISPSKDHCVNTPAHTHTAMPTGLTFSATRLHFRPFSGRQRSTQSG
jgi:hypothetical protein